MTSIQALILENPADPTLWERFEKLNDNLSGNISEIALLTNIRRSAVPEAIVDKLVNQEDTNIQREISKMLSDEVIDPSEARLLAIIVLFWKGDAESALILGQKLLGEARSDTPAVKAYHAIVEHHTKGSLGSSQILKCIKSVFVIEDKDEAAQLEVRREVINHKSQSSPNSVSWKERPGWQAIKDCTENDPTARFLLEYYMSALDGIDAIPKPAYLSDTPVVSVIIPVYNHWPLLFNCIKSMTAVKNKTSFEVIVADDCSTDETQALINLNPWVRHVRMEKNGRFILNCNNAARSAKGTYIYFLNNDTIVLDGWLDQIVATFKARENAGIVGSQVLFPDSSVQESGGIIWPDGEAWNYGRHIDKANLFKANYSRPVDYVSGCALAIKRDLWEAVGGFGEEFVPAYCEDSDLCFKVQSLNHEVWVQTRSKIIHFEGLSNSKDITKGLKLYQKTNLQKLNAKWKLPILQRGIGDTRLVIHASNRRLRTHKTVLVVDHYVPQHDKDAGSRTVRAFCESLVDIGWNVIFLPENFTAHEPYTSEIEGLGVMVLYGPYAANHYEQILRDEVIHVDAILYNRPHITKRFRQVLSNIFPAAKTLYYTHDLHGLREQLELKYASHSFGEPIEIDKTKLLKPDEEDIVRNVDLTLVCSSKELTLLSEYYSNIVLVCPYAVALPASQSITYEPYYNNQKFEILFVGGFGHKPNLAGLEWFVENVLPLLSSDYILHVVGSRCPEEFEHKLQNNSQVVYHGFIDDMALSALLEKLRVSIAPLPYGAGIKGKVVEALAAGHTVVGTEYGIEGLDDAPENVYIKCSSPQEFVQGFISIFARNGVEWMQSDRQAKEYVRSKFNAEAINCVFLDHLGPPLRDALELRHFCPVASESIIEGMHLMPSSQGLEHDGWLLRSNRLVLEPASNSKCLRIKCYLPDGDSVDYQGDLELYAKISIENHPELSMILRIEKGVNHLDLHLPSTVKTTIVVVELEAGYVMRRSNSEDIRDLIMLINSIVLD